MRIQCNANDLDSVERIAVYDKQNRVVLESAATNQIWL